MRVMPGFAIGGALVLLAALGDAGCGSVTSLGADGGAGTTGGTSAGTTGGTTGGASGSVGQGGGGAAGQGGAGQGGAQGGNPCQGLAEAQCLATTSCRADYCAGCQAKVFAGCSRPVDPPPSCPAIKCVAPCSSVTTLSDCEARTDCHSVFMDPGTCGCGAPGCCAHFSSCADGDKANCKGPALCRAATPFCELPFVVSYTGTCYEGCVNMKDCAP